MPRVREPEVFYASGDTLSSMWKATGADEPAALLRGLQGRSVYVYRFDWDEAPTLLYLADLGQMLGASHGFDIPFVFGHWYLGRQARVLFSEGNRAGREELSAAMRSYWAEFARTGDPASGRDGNLPRWQPWEPGPDAEKFLALDTREDGGIRMLNDVASREEVLASVETDTRLASQRERCAVYSQLASFGRGFDQADYPRAGAQGCLDVPLGGYPWNGD